MSKQVLDVTIAGAGLLGHLFAWRLHTAGHRVKLYDKAKRNKHNNAAWTAAAMISPMSEVVVSERSIYDLGIKSMTLWEKWLQELELNPPLYQRSGSIAVAHPQDENELRQFHQELTYHLKSDNNARWLNQAELELLEPDLNSGFEHALHLPDEAHLYNREFLTLLSRKLEQEIEVHWESCFSTDPWPMAGGKVVENFDLLLDCRGLGASESKLDLRGVRGEVIHVETSEIKLQRPIRLMHPRYKLYVVPKANNRFILGATELESSDSSPMSVQSALELCSALYTINPAFAEARILELDANLRPALKDNLPAIVESEIACKNGAHKKLVSVNGLYRHGYLIAPALVEKVLSSL